MRGDLTPLFFLCIITFVVVENMNREKLLNLLNTLETTIQEIKNELDLDTIKLDISDLNMSIDDYDEIFYEDEE